MVTLKKGDAVKMVDAGSALVSILTGQGWVVENAHPPEVDEPVKRGRKPKE